MNVLTNTPQGKISNQVKRYPKGFWEYSIWDESLLLDTYRKLPEWPEYHDVWNEVPPEQSLPR